MATDDNRFMAEALALAAHAETLDEIPVGAVLVFAGQIIGRGFNRPISGCDPTAHAEIMALREGALRQGNYRLPNTTLYVTIEPCAMCYGASIHARVERIVYGAQEPKAGVCSTQQHWLNGPWFNHSIQMQGGVMAEPAKQLMQQFFARRRREKLAARATRSCNNDDQL